MTLSREFSFLQVDADRVGRTTPLPQVARLSVTTESGRDVSALRFGATAPEVVLLHGAGLNAHTFDPTLLALDLPAVSLDLPGHGRSSWRDDASYTPITIAADVATAIRALTSGPVHLVGQSLGGLTAAAMLPVLRDLVQSVTVIDITPGVSPATEGGSIAEFISGKRAYHSIDEIVDRAIEFGIGDDRAALTRGVTLNTRVRRDGLLEWTHHFAHLDGLGATSEEGSGNRPFEALWQPLHTAAVPVQLIRGTHGIVNEELLNEWQTRLPHSTHSTLEGGHNLQEHTPALLAHALADFMQP